MRPMRQIPALFLAIVMALSLAACGGSETTVTLRGDITDDMGGIPTTDTWILTAKDDVVQTIKEVLALDLSEYDDTARDSYISRLDSLTLEPAKDIEGLECTSQMTDGVYTIELTVDCTGSAVQKAVEAGLFTLDGSSNRISLEQTQASLEQQGYEVVVEVEEE